MQRLVIVLPLSRYSREEITMTGRSRARTSNSFLYIIGMLLSQGIYEIHRPNSLRAYTSIALLKIVITGGPCVSKSLLCRIVAGVWCLATFVLVQAYTSLLITYIIAPNNSPLIESVHDLTKTSDIKLIIDIRSGFDDMISVTIFLNILKKIALDLEIKLKEVEVYSL